MFAHLNIWHHPETGEKKNYSNFSNQFTGTSGQCWIFYIRTSCDGGMLHLSLWTCFTWVCICMPSCLQTTYASACIPPSLHLRVRWDMLECESGKAGIFLGALCDRASGRSGTSARVECHNVPVSPWDVPKERGKRQPPPTLPIHHRDTTCCSHGKPTTGQSLWTRAGRRRGETGLAIH